MYSAWNYNCNFCITAEEESISQYEFGIKGLINKRELLQVGDPVQFQVDSKNRAVNIIAIRKKQRAHVDAIKGLSKFKIQFFFLVIKNI